MFKLPHFSPQPFLLVALLVVARGATAQSIIFTVPPDLSPGQTYRLVFVTADTSDTYSQNISDYNAFVTTEANGVPALAALGATWTVIGSTEAVSAIANINVAESGVIYNLAGQEVAPNSAALFAVVTTPLLNPIAYDQFGNVQTNEPIWTGTCVNNNAVGATCEGDSFGDGASSVGTSSATSVDYLANGSYYGASDGRPFYAISSTLTVPPTPCDINGGFGANITDVQAIINEALGLATAANDLNSDGVVNVVDVQIAINAVCGTLPSSSKILNRIRMRSR
jgi:hypothetical protein